MSQTEALTLLNQKLESDASNLPLAQAAHDIVPGEGSSQAEIVFIGEAPGSKEAELRRPFVGRSGQLFRHVLRDVGVAESSVYITNIVKARPPENRDPDPAEIAAYQPYLDKEIEILQPRLIVTLGRLSMAKFLSGVLISQVHGRLHKVTWGGRVLYVLPMYHPAAALRNPKMKEAFIADFQKLQSCLKWIRQNQNDMTLKDDVVSALL